MLRPIPTSKFIPKVERKHSPRNSYKGDVSREQAISGASDAPRRRRGVSGDFRGGDLTGPLLAAESKQIAIEVPASQTASTSTEQPPERREDNGQAAIQREVGIADILEGKWISRGLGDVVTDVWTSSPRE